MKSLFKMVTMLWCNRNLIISLTVRDLSARYVGTFAGILWLIVQPLVLITVYWVVFSLGFRAMGPGGTPFLVYFLPAFVAWFMFNETIISSQTCILNNPHLVKNIVFPTQLLPIVHLLSSLFIHGIMLLICIIFLIGHGYVPSLGNIFLLIYFLIAQAILALGISWLTSALNLFFRDVSQIMSVLMNVWFWATPIVWPLTLLGNSHQYLLNFNPIFYIVEGYRIALVTGYPINIDIDDTIFFWLFAITALIFGGYIFKTLKKEFADVL